MTTRTEWPAPEKASTRDTADGKKCVSRGSVLLDSTTRVFSSSSTTWLVDSLTV